MHVSDDTKARMRTITDRDGVVHVLPLVRTPFNYDRRALSTATRHLNDKPTKTQQNFKEECDINTIVRRFGLTGELPDNIRPPQYVDYEGIFDFQGAMNAVLRAEEAFMQVPAEIRARFNNDPQKYLEFCGDPRNLEEGRKLGLFKPAPVEPPAPAPAPTPPAPAVAGTSGST